MFLALKRYADFRGRSGRKEYWMFYLLLCLVAANGYAAMYVGYAIQSKVLLVLYGTLLAAIGLAVLVPSIAVTVRRLHDIDISGWVCLLVLIPYVGGLFLLALTLIPGTTGPNQYGAPPASL
jgi:uncharacterized membrane protein YhaH (DUF805 family)